MRKKADLQKLDAKGISPQALNMLLGGNTRGAFSTPGLVALTAQRAERRRRLNNAIRDPMANLPKPKAKGPAAEVPQGMALSPMAPGVPTPPSNVAGMFSSQQMAPASAPGGQPMTQFASALREFIKQSNGEEQEESSESEQRESLPAGIEEALVNFIAQEGRGIDDEEFHEQAEGMGVDPHEAEEAMYRLIAGLVGGENDLVRGGLAAGMPTEQFPQDQLEAGVEVEKEHTPSTAIAQEIAKDHLVESDDYYEPRLADLEKNIEKDKEEGKAKGVGNLSEDEMKARKAAAYKWGFLRKLASLGLKPSDLEDMVKHAARGGTFGGELLHQIGETGKGGLKLLAELGKLGIIVPAGLALLGGSALGYGGYRLSRPKYETPEDIRAAERIALYRRLGQQARAKTERMASRRARKEAPRENAMGDILSMSRSVA